MWRQSSRREDGAPSGRDLVARAMLALRLPVEGLLTRALRRVARGHPEVLARLGPFQSAAFLISPSETPVAFRLQPDGLHGRVSIVRGDDPGPFAAVVRGPLLELLALFEGSLDADSAFFSRTVHVEGDTEAVVALHNTLEAADLSLADLLGLPFGAVAIGRGLRILRRGLRPAHVASL